MTEQAMVYKTKFKAPLILIFMVLIFAYAVCFDDDIIIKSVGFISLLVVSCTLFILEAIHKSKEKG